MPRFARLAFLTTLLGLAAAAGLAAPAIFGASAPPPPAASPAPGRATIESLTFTQAEASPESVDVIVRGTLPDGCTEIDAVRQSRVAGGFQLEILTRRAAPEEGAGNCLMVRLPFQHIVRLDTAGLPAGVYTVAAAGRRAEFRQPGGTAHRPPQAAIAR